MGVSARDARKIGDLGRRAQACESMPDLQAAMFFAIDALVGCESGVCVDSSNTPFGWQFLRGLPFGVREAELRDWCRNHQAEDPFVVRLAQFFRYGSKRVFTSSDIASHMNYDSCAFYNEFLKPQSIYHIMTIGLEKANMPRRVPGGMIGLHRPRGKKPFSEADITRVEALLPHFTMALQRVQIIDMTLERESILDVLAKEPPLRGIMILERDGAPTYVDAGICGLLGLRKPPDTSLPTTLARDLPRGIRQACEALQGAGSGAEAADKTLHLQLTQPNGDSLACSIHSRMGDARRPHFIVCFRHPSQDPAAAVAKKFDLTAREVEVAHLVVKGLTNPQIARLLHISVRTVQNHLRSIYGKVDVNNRTSLATHMLDPMAADQAGHTAPH
jgi:DNA-binding CsgD family transcriptional regulator